MAESSSDLPLPKCLPHTNNPEDFDISLKARVVGPKPGSDGIEGAPACPCGWGPTVVDHFGNVGTPQPDSYGVYKASYPPWNSGTILSNGGYYPPPQPENQPTCAIRVPFGQSMPFIGQCWTEYLNMPFCVAQANGTNLLPGGLAFGPNGHAKCRSDGEIAALTQQDRVDIYNNTYTSTGFGSPVLPLGTHPNGKVTLPLIKYMSWGAVNPNNQFSDILVAPYQTDVSWNSAGHILTQSCGYGFLACPQTCFGCTAQTVTNCTSNPGACQGYDPAASLLLFDVTKTIKPCCVHGCMDDTTLSNGYPDINGDDTNGNPCLYPCQNGYFNQNYNPLATCDDGSCIPPPYGCIDIQACNFNPLALVDDGTCCYVLGCTDPLSLNYNPNACCDDGSCCYTSGCTNPIATNYNPNACYDDGSCIIPTIPGCMDSYACNYNSSANISVPTDCVYPGCRHPNALNYNPSMPAYDCDCNFIPTPHALNNPPHGTSHCCVFNSGCADSTAYNYNASYQGCDNGLGVPVPSDTSCCEYPTWHCSVPLGVCKQQNNQYGYSTIFDCQDNCKIGCTDQSALNYDPNASIPCGPFNGYPTYLSCCDYPIIHGCTDSLASPGSYNPSATVDDGSCSYQPAKAWWDCNWGSIYNPSADPHVYACNVTDSNGNSFYPTLNNSPFNSSRCWNWDNSQGIWSLVLLRPGGGGPPNGQLLLWDSVNPHPTLGDLTDPNNPKLILNSNLTSSNPNYPAGPLFSFNSNVVTHNGISNFGYWMPIMSIPQPPDYNLTFVPPGTLPMNHPGFSPGLFVRLEGMYQYQMFSSQSPPPQCCITRPSYNPNAPCQPFIQPAGGTLGEEPDVPIINGVARPRPDDNLTPMSYRQLGLTLKNIEKNPNPTIPQEQALEAFRKIGKEPTPVIVPNLAGSIEWWRCNHLSSPCFCEVCPYVNGQQVLDMMTFGSHYLGTDASSCLNAANCCDPPPPPPVNSWACVKKAIPPGPTGISPSGWRYECEDVGLNGSGALYETLQACQASPCEGDPNKSYSPPCTTLGAFPIPYGCTTHNNSDCGGLIDCYVFKQDCNSDYNCPDVTPLP